MDSKQKNFTDLQLFLNGFENDPHFNKESIIKLAAEMSEVTALRVLARFIQTLGEIKRPFENALATESFDSVWMFCHKISSSAELLGFINFANHARKVEIEIRDENIETADKLASTQLFLTDSEKLRPKIIASNDQIKNYF